VRHAGTVFKPRQERGLLSGGEPEEKFSQCLSIVSEPDLIATEPDNDATQSISPRYRISASLFDARHL
jgi:hypothetical protein